MKVTFILKDLTDTFFNGNGGSIQGLNNKSDLDKFKYLAHNCHDLKVTMKIGNSDSFRDKVELNQILKKQDKTICYKLEPRRGYKLATFEISS